MSREITIDHDEISNSQTITEVNEKKFKEQGLDIHVNEVEEINDDHKARKRHIKIKNTKYFGPWSHRG
jgi:hypothetical protein